MRYGPGQLTERVRLQRSACIHPRAESILGHSSRASVAEIDQTAIWKLSGEDWVGDGRRGKGTQ